METADDDIEIESRVGELLERGLERYGDGDLEGALSDWKHALVLDPDNEKAAHYATYVEDNHDLAEAGSTSHFDPKAELEYPFGLEELGLAKLSDSELGDYESMEVVDAKQASPSSAVSPEVGDGWNVDEGWVADLVEKSDTLFAARETSDDEGPLDLQLGPEPESEQPESIESASASLEVEVDDEDSPPMGDADFELGKAGPPSSRASSNQDRLSSAGFDLSEEETRERTATRGRKLDDFDAESLSGLEPLPGLPGHDGEYPDMEVGSASNDDIREEEMTGQHISLPPGPFEEQTGQHLSKVDRSTQSGQFRAPTQDPSLAQVSVSIDEALLSLEDSTREIEIGDVSNVHPPSYPGQGSIFDAQEDGDSAPSTAELDKAEVIDLLTRITNQAPAGDSNERTAFIVDKLIEHALDEHRAGNHESAALSVGEALEQADDCAAAQKLIFAHEGDLVSVLIAGLCEPSEVPEMVVPLTDIPLDQIDNRAAFLLTRVDGVLSLEEILDISGMSKLETLRHLSRMHSRSYLRVP